MVDRHSFSCIILHTAFNLLDEQGGGLERKVFESVMMKKRPTSSSDLCRLLSGAILKLWPQLRRAITNMASRHRCSEGFKGVRDMAIVCPEASPTRYTGSEIIIGKFGRMLVTTRGIGKGAIVLEDAPFLACLKGSCECGDCDSSLLHEHVSMAWLLYLCHHTDHPINPDRNHTSDPDSASMPDIEFSSSSSQRPVCSSSRYDSFITSVQSGLTADVMTEDMRNEYIQPTSTPTSSTLFASASAAASSTARPAERDQRSTSDPLFSERGWSFRSHCVLTCVSVIIALYSSKEMAARRVGSHATTSTARIAHGKDEKDEVANAAWIVLQILSRLPTNVHAVSSVVYSTPVAAVDAATSSTETGQIDCSIEQVRLGYALYLHASSVNHSCRPNASVRYSFSTPPPGPTEVLTLEQRRSRLASARVHVVGLCSVPHSNELCISYGPMSGAHAYRLRQTILRRQYLFVCECSACGADKLDMLSATAQTSPPFSGTAITENDSTNSTTTRRRSKKKDSSKCHSEALEGLCVSLGDLRLSVSVANTELTEVLNLARLADEESRVRSGAPSSQTSRELLINVSDQTLMPIFLRLLQLRQQHFSQSASPPLYYKHCSACGLLPRQPPQDSLDADLYREYCSLYCCVLDMMAHLAAKLYNYAEAADYVSESISCMVSSGTYVDTDVAVARERVKLAGLLLSCGNAQAARVVVRRAIEDLSCCVDVDDCDYVEANMICDVLFK